MPWGVATLEYDMAQAVGRAPVNERKTYESLSASPVRTVVLKDGDDERVVTQGNGLHRESGRAGDVTWHQNENGLTVIDEHQMAEGRDDGMRVTAARITKPIVGYTLTQIDTHGNGQREFVDGRTNLVVRRDFLGGKTTRTYTYDDFRTHDGYTQPWHWTYRDGYADDAADCRIVGDDFGIVRSADVAISPSRRRLLTFPSDGLTRLPARFEDNRVFVRVTIDGRGLDFLLDSGVGGISIDRDVAKSLGLSELDGPSIFTADHYHAGKVIVPRVAIGDITASDVVMSLEPSLPLGLQASSGVKAVGVLGFDVFASATLQIDYADARVAAAPPGAPNIPSATAVPLAIRFSNESPLVEATVNGAVGNRFVIDTGGVTGLLLFDPFVSRNAKVIFARPNRGDHPVTFVGLTGDVQATSTQLAHVQLGTIRFDDFPGLIMTNGSGGNRDTDGIFGSQFFRRFIVTMDYESSKIYLDRPASPLPR